MILLKIMLYMLYIHLKFVKATVFVMQISFCFSTLKAGIANKIQMLKRTDRLSYLSSSQNAELDEFKIHLVLYDDKRGIQKNTAKKSKLSVVTSKIKAKRLKRMNDRPRPLPK